jgi:glycosyltransferase involved in cell wall biosynthesis
VISSSQKFFNRKDLTLGQNQFRFSEGGLRLLNDKKKETPLLSIITVVRNGEKYLEETILSVLNQDFNNYEYIVIDGGSTDDTIKIIKKYNNKIDYWVSETDNGIYDAFNKGMILSKGEYIGVINSDDVYTPGALKIISNYIANNKNIDFIFGSVKKHWGVLSGYKPKKIYYSWGFYTSHSTGFFLKNSSAKKIGFYNLKYKYHSDYDFFYRMIVKLKMKGIATSRDEVVGIFRRGGFSSTINPWKLFKEEILIRYDNGQNIFLILFIFFYKLIFNLKKFLKSFYKI